MNIVINEKNNDRISAAINEAQKRAKVRTIGLGTVYAAIEIIDKKLYGIPNCKMKGVKASVDWNAQTFPGAYHGIPESTHFIMEHNGKAWKLTDVSRGTCRGSRFAFVITLTDEAKDALIDSRTSFDKYGSHRN